MLGQLKGALRAFWRLFRRLSGDDAYERYLRHHVEHHGDEAPLTRAAFFKQWQDNKWKGVKRCC
ncbi:YbdD/YjiX family protein [Pseudomethylobacillus aquaticus]|uniref:YbdD/YjiX family protein n=1 Tax=Pseudomethylobacillus aquaticus TaxID=2676064 RepID=A0A3N0V0L2_9PROT|nr:YbdD/YjiX family protein [Pseudomethylobacillus aquaticus]ROH86337.1 YbdD/YjiX family protein [Pseudomethylobacillus aquaticus]